MTEDQRREKFAKLAAEVDAAGGVMTMPEIRLRDAYGVAKFGWRVADAIETDYLPRVGLDILQPVGKQKRKGERLQRDQHATVVLYTIHSPVGKVIAYVHNPTPTNVRKLNEAVATEAIETLNRIREIICND